MIPETVDVLFPYGCTVSKSVNVFKMMKADASIFLKLWAVEVPSLRFPLMIEFRGVALPHSSAVGC